MSFKHNINKERLKSALISNIIIRYINTSERRERALGKIKEKVALSRHALGVHAMEKGKGGTNLIRWKRES